MNWLVMATDPWAQIVGLIIQSVGAIILALLFWLASRVFRGVQRILSRLDHLDECVDLTRQEQTRVREELSGYRVESESRDNLRRLEATERDQRIAALQKDYAGLEGWIKGWAKLPIDKPITEIHPREDHI